jgi:hypothetical protein
MRVPKLRKTTIIFLKSVRLSACASGRTKQPAYWTDFHEI